MIKVETVTAELSGSRTGVHIAVCESALVSYVR